MSEWEEGNGVAPPLPSPVPHSASLFLSTNAIIHLFSLTKGTFQKSELAGLVIFKLKE